ncbi:hypothetical protein ACP70R_038902 [Stipagrostis hirtigluma subsp. patula]
MECNKDDAVRSKEIAERKFRENDIIGAKKFALKAKALFKPLEGIDQMILSLDVHLRAQTKIGGETDWYGILEVSPVADEEAIKRHYKKLALQTHPDKNSSICAEGAFKLVSDAWSVLSDTTKREVYNRKRHMCGPGVHQNNYKSNANRPSDSSMSSMNGSDRPRKVAPHLAHLVPDQKNYKANASSTSSSSMPSVNGFCHQNNGPAIPRKASPHLAQQVPDTFWTYCDSCYMSFQYSREYVNRQLKCPVCGAVFVALEVRPPSSPVYPNGPKPMATDNNIGGTVPDTSTTGIQSGVACGNQNYDPTVLQQWSFLKSTTCAHSTRYTVQQTEESIRKQETGEVNVPANEEENIRRKVMQDVRKHAHAGSSLGRANAATRKHESAKRRHVNDGTKATWQSANACTDGDGRIPMPPARRRRSRTEASGAKKRKVSSGGDLNCESSGDAGRTSFGRVLLQFDTRRMLIENAKHQLRNKLEEFNSKKANAKNKEKMHTGKKGIKKSSRRVACSTAVDVNEAEMKRTSNPVHRKEDVVSKRVQSEEKERAQSSKQVSLEETEKLWQWTKPEIRVVYTRRKHREEVGLDATSANSATQHQLAANQEPSSDEGPGEMPVPDADFNNFGDHSESSFQSGQVWAVYDEEDGMPRYYALIRKVYSTDPFKVRLAYLKANDCNEFGASNWISCGFSKTCGEFRVDVSKDFDQLNIFSHKVTCEKSPGGIIKIFPRKGDIWALYLNWSPGWNEFTADDTMYNYELVEVLDSYSPTKGISVLPIVKVPGFVSVFKPLHDLTKTRRIPKEEMMRFSHQVPFHVLTGKEAHNSPEGCYELDPGSTPKELLHVVPPSYNAK